MENIKRVQSINFATTQEQKPAEKQDEQVYSVLYYPDIIQLFISYEIPVAQETLDKLKENTAYLIPRELETIKKVKRT